MKRILYNTIIIISIFLLLGCTSKDIDNTNSPESSKEINTVKAIINEKEYIIKLEDNETVKDLINMLPLNIKMNDLNGNEKYVNLDKSLPTNAYYPKRIYAGDVMLFGDNCLVIFYKSFDTTYDYTKIGHIDNLPDLGDDTITVTINN